jgi:hypothetical protein
MTTYLRPISDDELRTWLIAQREDYIEQRIQTGERPDEARRIADEQYAVLFPGGQPARGHVLSRLMDDDTPVGWLWIGPRSPDHPERVLGLGGRRRRAAPRTGPRSGSHAPR